MILLNAILFAAAALLASAAVLAAAYGLGRGKGAAARHLIWTGAFAVLLALPLAAVLLPSQMVWQLPGAPVVDTPAVAAPVAAAPAPSGIDTADVVLGLAALWLLGVAFHLGRFVLGGIGLVFLHRKSVPHIPHGIDGAPFRGLGWQLRLRTAPSECGPLTWGVLKPVVLLPKASVAWPRERLLSVLLHEAAHVRRKDCLARLIAAAACALYWPNPLVWFAARAARADGESAADDCVLTMGVRPTAYAEHLVGLAREFSGGAAAMSLSMADRAALEPRVQAILDPQKSRTGVTKMDVFKIAALGLTLTSALALARPSLAEATGEPAGKPAAAVSPDPATPSVDLVKPASEVKPVKHHIVRRIVLRDGAPMPDEPPPPPSPDALPPPPAPPAPGAIPAPPAPPAPPADVHSRIHIVISDADKAAMKQAASAETRRAMAEARKAIEDAHIDQVVADAMKKAREAMAKGKNAEADAQQAIAAAKIDKVVEEAMKKAEVALKNAQVKIVVMHKRLDKDGQELTTDITGPDDGKPEN
jgi:beta-lactamase regulating signal transducer with metallopeptidase domain